MNIRIQSISMVALMIATSTAYADGHVSINIDPFGWGAPPPVVYESPREYASPPMVYYGQGHWGDNRHWRGRGNDGGRHNDGGRSNHRGDGGH